VAHLIGPQPAGSPVRRKTHHETIHVHFSRGSHLLSGGRFSAVLRYGRSAVHLRGGATDKHGDASIGFKVRMNARGKVLNAVVTPVYRSHRYLGSNHVKSGLGRASFHRAESIVLIVGLRPSVARLRRGRSRESP
jgi:hypothetical protein